METIGLAPNNVRIPLKPNLVKFKSVGRGALILQTLLLSDTRKIPPNQIGWFYMF